MSASADQAWRPRLVALDIDGTLVDRNGLLPRAVAEAVELVIQAGVPVVLSTGRSLHGTRPIFDELSLPDQRFVPTVRWWCDTRRRRS